ncbi:hypothetical protein AVEN_40735-1 [Araneus ventricosus]|uniref:Uncharacterized protein n=1 Tax=Araneus ventricosus TaxID=182803 RepID=A0A4Y2EM34_ARAVE|nr:hypothetical protein AVEN_40735-1 [Araneus ventricosus]
MIRPWVNSFDKLMGNLIGKLTHSSLLGKLILILSTGLPDGHKTMILELDVVEADVIQWHSFLRNAECTTPECFIAFIKTILPMARAEAHKTRSSVNINLFGAPCELKEMQLTTYADIMRHYWLRNENRDVYLQLVDDLVKVAGEKVTANLDKGIHTCSFQTNR